MKKSLPLICLLASCVAFTSCAGNISSNTYTKSDVGVASKAVPGVIVSKRVVNIDNSTKSGGLAGATAGAVAGTMVGGNLAVNLMGAVGGAVIGGVIGNGADKAINHHLGFEYVVKLKGGSLISIVQSRDVSLHVNQRVLVVYSSNTDITESGERSWVLK